MESQKIIKLLSDNDVEFTTKKWYIINDQNNGDYGNGNESDSTIKFETKVIKPDLCDYSDVYILVTGKITTVGGNDHTKLAFRNCAPFIKCITHINDEHVENAEDLDIIMPMYNLLEYSDNYEDSSGSLYRFKRDEPPPGNGNVDVNTSSSFKYKSSLLNNTVADGDNIKLETAKIVVPLKYLSNFFQIIRNAIN